VTVVGHAPTISAGEFVQATGTWVNDRTHGPQFKASFLRAAPPVTVEGIERYFGSGMIRGIGPVYGKRLCGRSARRCSMSSRCNRRGRDAAGELRGLWDRVSRAGRDGLLSPEEPAQLRSEGVNYTTG
jgi:hypothetical protein